MNGFSAGAQEATTAMDVCAMVAIQKAIGKVASPEAVVGKVRLERPFLVEQGGRPGAGFAPAEAVVFALPDKKARSVGGHILFVPARIDSVG